MISGETILCGQRTVSPGPFQESHTGWKGATSNQQHASGTKNYMQIKMPVCFQTGIFYYCVAGNQVDLPIFKKKPERLFGRVREGAFGSKASSRKSLTVISLKQFNQALADEDGLFHGQML